MHNAHIHHILKNKRPWIPVKGQFQRTSEDLRKNESEFTNIFRWKLHNVVRPVEIKELERRRFEKCHNWEFSWSIPEETTVLVKDYEFILPYRLNAFIDEIYHSGKMLQA